MAVTELVILVLVLMLALVSADTECPKNVQIPRGVVLFPDKCWLGSVLRYSCPPGTRATPVSWRVCGPDGSWSAIRRPAACVSYYCSGPITLENGWLAPRQTRYRVGDVVRFHCQPGYLLYGPRNITCLSTGKWSAPPAVCDSGGSACENPGVPAGGLRVGDHFRRHRQVRYTCYNGLLMRGPKLRTCLQDGSWSGMQPVCEGPHAYDGPHVIAEYFSLSEQALLNPEQDLHLYFIIKASRSVGAENMETALDFMSRHSSQVVDFSRKRKAELIIFGESARRVKYDEVDHRDYEKFLNGSAVNTGAALQLVLSLIETNLNVSTREPPAKNILILITDERHNMGPSPSSVIHKMTNTVPKPDANLAEEIGTSTVKLEERPPQMMFSHAFPEIFVIGIGGAAERDSLDTIASQRAEPRAFYLPDYDGLSQIEDKVPEDACGVRGHRESGFERVFRGRNSADHQWPWQAAVLYNGLFIAGGSIISRQWVLTAAHVLFGGEHPGNFSVLTGVRHRTRDKSPVGIMKVEKYFIHQDFSETQFRNDIALLRLEEKLDFSSKIRPVCLPCTAALSHILPLPSQNWTSRCLYQDLILTGRGGEDQRTVSGVVTGWGLSGKKHILETNLKHGNILIKQRQQCRKESEAIKVPLTEEKFCARGDDGVDACKADSGGPFVIKRSRRWIQIGIVSYGTSSVCQNGTMGFYANVAKLMPWIREIVGQDMRFT
ncbi:complement factor B-like isoform X1 [Paramormyrops kingsleyae]|uniref:complement factor B-like isoform X1 n=1 Tax=Paramormyrops kingsleyae TaxID=1676925 RepID=UPI003B978D96